MAEITPFDSASNVTSSTKRSAKSEVWEHFTVADDDKTKAICNYCPKHKNRYSYNKGGTTNLMNHLLSKHKHKLKPAVRDSKQPRIDEMIINQPSFSIGLFEEYLVDWIVLNDQPFTVVESESFIKLLKLLKHNLKIVSADTIRRRILAKFDEKSKERKQIYQDLDCKVSFTTDCWTSPNTIAFMGVTAHYIDEDWNLKMYTLDFKHLPGTHSGSVLRSTFESILRDFCLENKTLGITLDNASNNDSFIEELSFGSGTSFKSFHHIRCFAHVLNLGVQAALDILKDEFASLRRVIRKVRSSPQSFLKFKELQNDMPLKPILDVPTRWNSTADMLDRALKLKDSLVAFSSIFDSGKKANEAPLSLSPDSWINFERLFEYLLPFRKATLKICGDINPSLSMVVPLYNILMDHLKTWMEKTDPQEPLHRASIIANAKITDYYDLTSDCYTISTVLDPRFGLNYYQQDKTAKSDSYKEVFDIVNAVYLRFYCPDESIDTPSVTDETEDFLFKLPSEKISPKSEFQNYCTDGAWRNIGRRNEDVLLWWKLNANIYPNLSRMARDYLAIPATSTSSERLFSGGKHLISDTRACLSPSSIQACQCLKSWLK